MKRRDENRYALELPDVKDLPQGRGTNDDD